MDSQDDPVGFCGAFEVCLGEKEAGEDLTPLRVVCFKYCEDWTSTEHDHQAVPAVHTGDNASSGLVNPRKRLRFWREFESRVSRVCGGFRYVMERNSQ